MINFLGIGAQKAATTWIFECLQMHPEVYFPGGKEIHFWDEYREKGTGWWLDIFHSASHHGRKQGEITPAYALLDVDTIRQVATVAPELRLLYSIRNPIARAWSHALMSFGYLGLEFDKVSDTWFIEHFTSDDSLHRSDYRSAINRWSEVFGIDMLHIIMFDDIVADPKQVLVGIARHLDIDPEFFHCLPDREALKPVFAGPGHAIRPGLLDFLRILYRPAIEDLAQSMNRDFRHWLAWDGRGPRRG